jgi:hypothetical protein
MASPVDGRNVTLALLLAPCQLKTNRRTRIWGQVCKIQESPKNDTCHSIQDIKLFSTDPIRQEGDEAGADGEIDDHTDLEGAFGSPGFAEQARHTTYRRVRFLSVTGNGDLSLRTIS